MSHEATNWAFEQPRRHCDMKPSEWAVLMVLANCHNPVNGCFPSQDYICTQTNLGERAVRDQLAKLRERGLIDWDAAREHGRRGSNRYRLGFEHGFQPANSAGSSTGKNEQVQPADSGSFNRQILPPNPVRESVKESEREARERGCESGLEEEATTDLPVDEPLASAERPATADFEKRVMRFCNGKGFAGGAWPNWDTSSPGHVARQFAKLSIAERREAERWRDAYLADVARRKKRPIPVANFLRDRLWTGLEPEILIRAERVATGTKKPELPADHAPPFGPVWSAVVHATLIAGPDNPEHAAPAGSHWLRAHLQKAWPSLARQFDAAAMGRGFRAGEVWLRLKDAMEFVPKDGARFEEWRAAYRDHGWPDLPTGTMDGAYFPKGGPEGLDDFAEAVRRLGLMGERQAAE